MPSFCCSIAYVALNCNILFEKYIILIYQRNSLRILIIITRKHRLPPIIFEIGSARNTPSVPICRAYGIRYVRGTTINTFRSNEKKIACFFLFRDLNTA